jgi:hypothetical protein
MITLQDKDTGTVLGTISEDELAFLLDSLEEESQEDTDYYITAATVDMLEEDGAPATLLQLLRGGLKGREGYDVQWVKG